MADKEETKIAVIGGGSAYCPGLVRDVLAEPDFAGAHLALMDVDPENLELIGPLCRRLAEAGGSKVRISWTLDQAEALDKAEIVLTTFRVGGFEARHLDESIPLRHGIIGHETIGPGGFFMALRTIPVMQEITRTMKRVCPGAVLLNYTNPTNIITQAVSLYTEVPIVGMCDQPVSDARAVARALGMPGARFALETAGLNHANWSARFEIEGGDAVAMMREVLDRVLDDPAVTGRIKRLFRLAAKYGRMPSSYLQYYYFHDEMLQEQRSSGRTRARVIMADELPPVLAGYREQLRAGHPVLGQVRGGGEFGDFAVDVMGSVLGDAGEVLILNVPNRGALEGFPAECVVEVPVRLGRRRAEPAGAWSLPGEVMDLLRDLAEYQLLTARAAWSGSRPDAVRALAANPLVPSGKKAGQIYREMAGAQAAHLPERLQ